MNTVAIFHSRRTRANHALVAVLEVGLAYAFGSLAINSGSIWQWALALMFVLGILHNVFVALWGRRSS